MRVRLEPKIQPVLNLFKFTTISYKIHLLFLVHACDSDPCKNGAICNKQGDGFTCICTDEYKGETCEEEGEFFTGVN